MDQETFKGLLDQYLTGEISPEEEKLLFEKMDEPGLRAILEQMITQDLEAHTYEEGEIPAIYARLQAGLAQYISAHSAGSRFRLFYLTRRIAAAAAVLLLIAAGAYFLFSNKSQKEIAGIQQQLQNSIAPGGNKAVLTLSNGKQIILDNAHNGMLASQGNSKVVKVDSGVLAYNQLATRTSPTGVGSQQAAVQYNTLSTPRGGQYQLVLPDGSKVWLNAASSIRYPAAFTGTEREVEITGEAYFEVTHNPSMPFIVKLPPSPSGESRGEVQVMGTHFNVNTYDDEPNIKVTLLEGSVRVAQLATHNAQLLKPGQQAQLDKAGQIILLNDADSAEAVAWKNGKFRFDVTSIEEVMRQISRWYDVEVEYKGTIRTHFWGSISRNVNVSGVFKMLEQTGGVKFSVEGRKVIVMPGNKED